MQEKNSPSGIKGSFEDKKAKYLEELPTTLETELLKVGRTEQETLKMRKDEYLKRAKKFRENFKKGIPINIKKYRGSIYERINELYARGGNKLVSETLQWIPIEVTLYTGFDKEHIQFDQKLLESTEQWWQNLIGTTSIDVGYDRQSGRAGPHSGNVPPPSTATIKIPKILINWRELKKGFELGLQYKQLITFLSVRSLQAVSFTDIIENIEYHYPFLADYVKMEMGSISYRGIRGQGAAYSMRLYHEAEIFFLLPIIQKKVQSGLITREQIGQSFKNNQNPNGIKPSRLTYLVKKGLIVSGWDKFVARCGVLPYYKSELNPEEFKMAGGESLRIYRKQKISSLIVKGKTISKMVSEHLITDMTYYHIKEFIHKEWGSYDDACRVLWTPRLKLAYQLFAFYDNFYDKIAEALPFIKYTPPSQDSCEHYTRSKNYYNLYYYTQRLLNDASPLDIIKLYRNKNLSSNKLLDV